MLDVRALGSLLWLPLLDRDGDLIGTIVLAWRRRDPRLSTQALEASQQFASLGARAISGSERVRAQTEVLEQVQALLLTAPPAWAAGFQIGVRYQSASGLAQIGGDFYDVVELTTAALPSSWPTPAARGWRRARWPRSSRAPSAAWPGRGPARPAS